MSEKRDEAQAAAWVREHANNVVDALDGIYPAIKLAVYAYLSGLAKGREMERQRQWKEMNPMGYGHTGPCPKDCGCDRAKAIRESGK